MFDDAWRSRLLEQFAGHLAADRPECWELATAHERKAQRDWVNAALERLPEHGRNRIFEHLLENKRFIQSYNELAVAAILIDAGYSVTYELNLYGQTPDLAVHSTAGRLLAIVEVANRLLPAAVDSQATRWEKLRSRVQRIPVPMLIRVVKKDGTAEGPDDGISKKIAHELRAWMTSAEFTHGVAGDYAGFYWIAAERLPGTHADLLVPREEIWANSDALVPTITEKVDAYAALCTRLDVPLIVVVAADPRHSIGSGLVQGAVEGKLTLTVNLNLLKVGPSSSGPLKMHATDAPHRWDPALSGVGWLQTGIDEPGSLTLFNHHHARISTDVVGERIIRAKPL